VHIQLQQEKMLVGDSHIFEMSQEEADGFVATLNQHFSDSGLTFLAPVPFRWYLRLPRVPGLTTHPLTHVRGGPVEEWLPEGHESAVWRAFLTESQMLLHDHPLNAAREARGVLSVNSLWLWGGGTRPEVKPSPWDMVYADDLLPHVLALAGGALHENLPHTVEGALHYAAGNRNILCIYDKLAAPAQYGDAEAWRAALLDLERHWATPLKKALEQQRIRKLTITIPSLGNASQVTVNRKDLWKVWRRRSGLELLHPAQRGE
jgi:hypothetical protein